MAELARDLSEGVCEVESFFGFGLGLATLLEAAAAVFIAVNFGGGGVDMLSSLSLLLSGLKMLLVFTSFFCASALVGGLLASFGGALSIGFGAGTGFLFAGLGAGFAGLVIGVTVADAFGLVGGFLFDFALASSDSEEYIPTTFCAELDARRFGFSLLLLSISTDSFFGLITGSAFFLIFFLSESVEACPLLGLLIEEFSVSEEDESSLPEEEEEEEEEELLEVDVPDAEDPSWRSKIFYF